MDQIFNELSVSACYTDAFSARQGMEVAVDVGRALATLGMSKTIRTTRDFGQRLLAPGYSVDNWKIDNGGDREKKIYFLIHATKSPYIEDFYDAQEQSDELIEFRFDDALAKGLGLSHLWKIVSISLAGDSRFEQAAVALAEHRVSSEGESLEEVSVITFSRLAQLDPHRDFILARLRMSIANGPQLMTEAKELLPRLAVGKKAAEQLEGFRGSEQCFPEIVNHLFELNSAMLIWSGGPFSPCLDFSTESESTMNNASFAAKRRFLCTDDIERTFKLHSKIKSANKRIYFYPVPEEKVVHIGYVGDHLPTTNYPT
jgi:hypothetical protein